MKDIKKFTQKSLMFLPFVIYTLLVYIVLSLFGEFLSVRSVLDAQRTNSRLVLYGPAYSNASQDFKLQSTIERKPQVVALGTSRVMQFRSKFFRDDVSFYNAGGGVVRLGHFRPFVGFMPGNVKPELFIVGLDQWMFNENWERSLGAIKTTRPPSAPDPLSIIQASYFRILTDWLTGKFSIRDLGRSPQNINFIGLNAVKNNNGFRNDGSYLYGKYLADPCNPRNQDYQFRNTLDHIANGSGSFQYCESVSVHALKELEEFLKLCKAKDIHVVAFFPPFAHSIYEKMLSMEEYCYLKKLEPSIRPVIESFGYEIYDFSDIATVGASDAETIDGLHGSEKTYLRIFIQMARSSTKLSPYAADMTFLVDRLNACGSHYNVFSEDEY